MYKKYKKSVLSKGNRAIPRVVLFGAFVDCAYFYFRSNGITNRSDSASIFTIWSIICEIIPWNSTRYSMSSFKVIYLYRRPRLNWIDTVTRDLKSIGMAWEDAEQAAVDREDWRGRVAQCVSDTG